MANPVKILGTGIVYLGLGAMFVMAIIGAFSLDILYLILLSQLIDRSGSNFIVSLLVWNMMFSSHDSLYENIGYSLLASPFISALSIGLSFAAGVPEFGVLLFLGWTGAFTILLAGAVVYGIGDALGAAFTSIPRGLDFHSSRSETTFSYDSSHEEYVHAHRSQPSQQSEHFPSVHATSSKEDFTIAPAANHDTWGEQRHFASPITAARPSAPYMHGEQAPAYQAREFGEGPPPPYEPPAYGSL